MGRETREVKRGTWDMKRRTRNEGGGIWDVGRRSVRTSFEVGGLQTSFVNGVDWTKLILKKEKFTQCSAQPACQPPKYGGGLNIKIEIEENSKKIISTVAKE